MQLATEEAQEMLLEEIPESPSTKPRHWYLAGAGLALLVVLGVAAKVVYRSPETLLQSKNFDINTVQEWEQIPGIDQVVEHAKTLELKQPLRNLNDLFYESQPEELPWIRTECVIDVVQGAAYLGQAVVFLYKAIKYDGIRCPDNSPAGCAASQCNCFRTHCIAAVFAGLGFSTSCVFDFGLQVRLGFGAVHRVGVSPLGQAHPRTTGGTQGGWLPYSFVLGAGSWPRGCGMVSPGWFA